ncbi:MAG TPA: type IV secretory system conjugative DNA transfer family protein [Bryobacteraceae bacterium]|nr:type IV secretory system conjugative DNA transfer family protein [Bryobacteraceae bacterium]
MAAPAATSEIKKLRQGFPQQALTCLAVMAAIHILPKSHDPRDTLRLAFTIAYFGAALMLLWLINKPRAIYMKRVYELQYAEGGPALEQNWRMYLSALNRFCGMVSYLLLAFVGANAVNVLSQWIPAFAVLDSIATLAWWGSLAGILTYPWWGKSYLSDVMQKRRLLQESLEATDFQPKNLAALEAEQAVPEGPPVEVMGDHAFSAGRFTWNWKDFYKNCVVFGMTGTGKTVCVLNALLDGLMMSAQGADACAGLILDPKGDFKNKIHTVCRKAGRERDVVVINPYSPQETIRWNPLDSDDDELEVAARFAAALESLGMKSGTSDTFWIDSAKKFIRHAIALLRITNPEGEPPTFAQIGTLASSMVRLSETADLVADEDSRADQCLAFFAEEWIMLADQTRSSIQAYITNMIDPFLMEPYATLFAGRSTRRISQIIDEGKLLYVYMPIADKENMSKVICTFVKLEYYREILKRVDKKRSSFFLCDEFQAYFTPMPGKGDADFFERSRQSNHANIIATQNYPALTKVAGDRESVVSNLLGNCAVKIFLRNTDDRTNDYASKLFGQAMVVLGASSMNQGAGKGMGANVGASANRQYDAKVRPEEFVGLAVPAEGVAYADAIVHLASRAKVTRETLRWRVHPLKD